MEAAGFVRTLVGLLWPPPVAGRAPACVVVDPASTASSCGLPFPCSLLGSLLSTTLCGRSDAGPRRRRLERVHQPAKAVEQVARVVGAGTTFRVILDREGDAGDVESLDGGIVEVVVCQTGTGSQKGVALDGEPVILRRDLDPSRPRAGYGMVDPAMAETELVGVRAQGERQQLMSEADAEDRKAPEELLRRRDGVGHRLGVPRAVRQEDTVV